MIEWIANNKEWFLSGIGVSIVGTIFYLLKIIISRIQKKLSVLVHKAYFVESSTPYYFVKVINLTKDDLEITHVWFKTNPEIHIIKQERPLPFRLKPNETWETWIKAENIPEKMKKRPFDKVRVMLSNGKIYSSKKNNNVPSMGNVAGKKYSS